MLRYQRTNISLVNWHSDNMTYNDGYDIFVGDWWRYSWLQHRLIAVERTFLV